MEKFSFQFPGKSKKTIFFHFAQTQNKNVSLYFFRKIIKTENGKRAFFSFFIKSIKKKIHFPFYRKSKTENENGKRFFHFSGVKKAFKKK